MSSPENDILTPGSAPGGTFGMSMQKDDEMGGGGSGGGAPRKRVSQACVPCAKRKTKCDGAQPICGQCQQRDLNQECEYNVSRRNKKARLGRQYPNDGYNYEHQMQPYEQQGGGYMYPNQLHQGQNDYDQQQAYKEDVHPQNYSPLHTLAAIGAQRVPQNVNNLPARIPQPQQQAISREVSTRLIVTYFDTIHPMWPILYKPMYGEMTSDLPDMLHPAVMYAIYAIAACVQPEAKEEDAKDTPLPAQLFESALFALQRPPGVPQGPIHPLHLLRPTIENCQALTILALQQHGVAESSSAALLLGLASSMAIELKLHRRMPAHIHFDTSERETRSRLWWNIFVLDKMMACEMKKPVILRTEETDTPYPSVMEADEFRLLKLRVAGQNRVVDVKSLTMSGFVSTIQITMLMERVCIEVYSQNGRIAIREGTEAAMRTRENLHDELTAYRRMMDDSALGLDINGPLPAAPVVITNMVWMWCALILVYRPSAAFRTKHPKQATNEPIDPLNVCFVAANNICDTLEKYAENLPKLSCDMIFPIYLTASTLSHIDKNTAREDPKTVARIDMCVKWLLILGKNWKTGNARQAMLVNAGDLRAQPQPQHDTSRPLSRSATNTATATMSMNSAVHSSPTLNQISHLGRTVTPALSVTGTPGPRPKLEEQPTTQLPGHLVEDWTFLDQFGDAADEFYAMDAEFRELLQNSFDPHLGANGPVPIPNLNPNSHQHVLGAGGQMMG